MSTLSSLVLWTLTVGCQSPPLPTSQHPLEEWLQTSRQVRYPFSDTEIWQGWILHPPQETTQITIVSFNQYPTQQDWIECIRHYTANTNHIWLSSTTTSALLTTQYAKHIAPQATISKVAC